MSKLDDLLQIDHDEMGPWSVRELQDEAAALQAEISRLETLILGFDEEDPNCQGPVDALESEARRIRVAREKESR